MLFFNIPETVWHLSFQPHVEKMEVGGKPEDPKLHTLRKVFNLYLFMYKVGFIFKVKIKKIIHKCHLKRVIQTNV